MAPVRATRWEMVPSGARWSEPGMWEWGMWSSKRAFRGVVRSGVCGAKREREELGEAEAGMDGSADLVSVKGGREVIAGWSSRGGGARATRWSGRCASAMERERCWG